MGMFQNFIPRAQIPIARESSHLLSPRESGQRGQLWKYIRDDSARSSKLTNSVSVTQRAIERMSRRFQSFSTFHPFKIYPPSPNWPNSNSAYATSSSPNPERQNRTYRIRNGLVLTTTVLGLQIEGTGQYGVKGTDLVDLPYDEVFLYRGNGQTIIPTVQEYVVPDKTDLFLFWVEVYNVSGTNYAVVRFGTSPDEPMDVIHDDGVNPMWESDNPWSTFPAPDGTHFIIGSVDTNQTNGLGQPIVRQLQTTDIMSGGSGGGELCPFG